MEDELPSGFGDMEDEPPAGFVITVCYSQPSSDLLGWAHKRFLRTAWVAHPTDCAQCLVGALFKETPRSFQHFRRLVVTNFKNWGIERTTFYERGWVRYISRDEYVSIFRQKILNSNWSRLVLGASEKAEREVYKKHTKRQRTIRRGLKKLKRKRLRRALASLVKACSAVEAASNST